MLLSVGPLRGQGTSATLTGVVSDPSGAVVANAKVALKDALSGSLRDTVTNGDGYFTFASVPVGTYNLSVEATGFQTYKADNIALGGSEKRNLNISLTVGAASQTIEVNAQEAPLVTLDSPEKSYTLGTKELENLIQVGSNAAQYISIVPGFALQNGTSNRSNYTGEVIGINANGDAGSQSPLNNAYAYNGLPGNSLEITMDGSHVADPGCNCDTPVNPNSDFLQEFRVLTGNYGAENQKGPILITSVTKAGGQEFHGNGFFSARNAALNANDALLNASGAPKPQNKYYYPGGSIGGPVIIPGTSFNKNKDKLFFFAGFEYFYQVLDTGLLRATVPTANMFNASGANFSTSELEKIGIPTGTVGTGPSTNTTSYLGANNSQIGAACPGTGPGTSNAYLPCLNANALAAFGGVTDGSGGYNVTIPTADLNPNMLALMKLLPAPNADPATTGGFNWRKSEIFNQNNTQFVTRVDYNISNNTKLFVRYNIQKETQLFPVGLWWRQTDQLPYPTSVEGKNRSDSISGSLTHVFSPTMTNEVVLAYTRVLFPNVFSSPDAVNRTKLGLTLQGLFKNNVQQIPSFGGNGGGSEAAVIFNPGGFELGGASQGLFANKYMPSVSDTLSKVWGTHTIKAGFFWERIRNTQPANNNSNGYLQFMDSQNTVYTTGDSYADEVLGIASYYNEASFNRLNNEAYNTTEFFAQDDWKVNKRLTINYGMRFSHMQPWIDQLPYGFSIFDTTAYAAAYSANPGCTNAPTYCGFEWHHQNPSVPLGGFPTRALFYQPRLGAAYDVFGDAKTVLRGGWGRYYFHTGQATLGLDSSAGVVTESFNNGIVSLASGNQPILANPLNTGAGGIGTYAPWCPAGSAPGCLSSGNAGLDTVNFSAVPSGPAAVDGKDDREAYTDNWNFTISRQLPWSSLLELSYIGNRSRDLPSNGNGGTLNFSSDNINLVPVGAMLASNNGGANPNLLNSGAVKFRPSIPGYGDLNIDTHNGYSKYNGLQAMWVRSRGRYTINLNYTYSKSMGILGYYDQFNLSKNYGVQPDNRPHVFNAAYSVELPKANVNKFVGGFVNGWQVSGILQWESGPNLSATQGQNFGMNLNGAIIPNSTNSQNPKGIAISNLSILGTPDIQLQPILTCNPTSHLAAHQYINGSCFAAPTTVSQNGSTILPPIYGPAFFNWDMGLFKDFNITEHQKVQFRFNFYNWMNHPLWSFNGNNLGLSFDKTTLQPNNPDFGYVTQKQGHRIIEMGIKYNF